MVEVVDVVEVVEVVVLVPEPKLNIEVMDREVGNPAGMPEMELFFSQNTKKKDKLLRTCCTYRRHTKIQPDKLTCTGDGETI